MERGKAIITDGIRLPDEQQMKDIDKIGYILKILETVQIKEKEMKEKFQQRVSATVKTDIKIEIEWKKSDGS